MGVRTSRSEEILTGEKDSGNSHRKGNEDSADNLKPYESRLVKGKAIRI